MLCYRDSSYETQRLHRAERFTNIKRLGSGDTETLDVGCDGLVLRKAALTHQRADFRIAAAELAIAFRRVNRVADGEDVIAEPLRDLSIIRAASFLKRFICVCGNDVGPQIAVARGGVDRK